MERLLRLALLCCFLVLQTGLLNAQSVEWVQTLKKDFPYKDISYTSLASTDVAGNTFICGGIFKYTDFGKVKDPFLVKYDAQGNYQWTRSLDTTSNVNAITTDASGNFYICGSIKGKEARFGNTVLTPPSSDHILFYIAKYNTQGDCLWAVKLAESMNSAESIIGYEPLMANSIAVSKEGNIAITGYLFGEVIPVNAPPLISVMDVTQSDTFLLMCDSSGNLLWAKQSVGAGEDIGKDVSFDEQGNVLVTGSFSEIANDRSTGHQTTFDSFTLQAREKDIFIAKYAPTGKCLWVQQAGSELGQTVGIGIEEGNGIVVDKAGNSYVTGGAYHNATFGAHTTQTSSNATTLDYYSGFLAKYSPSGECAWVKNLLSKYSVGNDVALNGNSLYVTGNFMSSITIDGKKVTAVRESSVEVSDYELDLFVAKFFTDGTHHWAARFGDRWYDGGTKIGVSADHKVYLYGETVSCYIGPTFVGGPFFLTRLSDGANTISGRIFKDSNNNGLFDSGELPAKGTVVEILPDPFYTITNDEGIYYAHVPEGTYSIRVTQPPIYYGTTTIQTATFSALGGVEEGKDFALKLIREVVDGFVELYGDRARPGFETFQRITYGNKGSIAHNGTIELTLDANYEYLSSLPAATINGNKLSWNYRDLKPDENRTISLILKLPATTALGTILSTSVLLSCEGNDVNLKNNTRQISQVVIGAYDPNDKAVSDTILSPVQITASKPLSYTIRFQNKGTAEATFVTIKDSLSEKLDIGSFQMLEASHPYSLKMTDKGVLEWFFDNINLPAEMYDEPGSHGFVRFRILPKKEVAIGDKIENKAYIYFDFNEAIITNTSKTTIEKYSQAISFSSIDTKTVGEAPFTLHARTSSGLEVGLSVVSGQATLEGNTLTLKGPGLVTLKATQRGNDHYLEAEEVRVSFCVLPAKPVITADGVMLNSSASEGNRWFKDGVAINGATAQSLLATEKGDYLVKVAGSCGEAQSSEVYKVTVAGLNVVMSANLRLYPNPTKSDLSLELPLGARPLRVTLLTLIGQVVLQKELTTVDSKFTISVYGFSKGIYLLKVETSEGSFSKRFIKE